MREEIRWKIGDVGLCETEYFIVTNISHPMMSFIWLSNSQTRTHFISTQSRDINCGRPKLLRILWGIDE